MQLKTKIGLAVGALMSASSAAMAGSGGDRVPWAVQSSLLYYSEKDAMGQSRITAIKPLVLLTRQRASDDYDQFRFVYDALSGASPNGGFASSQAQSFTSPSGMTGYTTQPGKTPLDPNFKDDRIALGYTAMRPLSRMMRHLYGVSLSTERDYSSLGLNYSLERDLGNRNTTLTVGGAFSYDRVNPVGGKRTPFSWMSQPTAGGGGGEGGEGVNFSFFKGERKNALEGIVGISHVLNRLTLVSASYSFSYLNGYLTDPYKIVPVVDAATGLPTATNPPKTYPYRHEKRPSTRLRHAIKLTAISAIGHGSLHLGYRYYTDDWGVTAHTLDARYNYPFPGGRFFVAPHLRYGKQSSADFYRLYLKAGAPLPDYASSDIRLAAMTTTTLGAMIGYRITPKTTLTLNAERMRQTGDSHPPEAIGDQKNHDMFPALSATMVTMGVRTEF